MAFNALRARNVLALEPLRRRRKRGKGSALDRRGDFGAKKEGRPAASGKDGAGKPPHRCEYNSDCRRCRGTTSRRAARPNAQRGAKNGPSRTGRRPAGRGGGRKARETRDVGVRGKRACVCRRTAHFGAHCSSSASRWSTGSSSMSLRGASKRARQAAGRRKSAGNRPAGRAGALAVASPGRAGGAAGKGKMRTLFVAK